MANKSTTKTDKAERAARAAIDEAATAVSRAKKAAKALPSKQARSLDDYIDDARRAADVSKKKVTRKPKKVAKTAERAARRLERAVAKAVSTTRAARSASGLPGSKVRRAISKASVAGWAASNSAEFSIRYPMSSRSRA